MERTAAAMELDLLIPASHRIQTLLPSFKIASAVLIFCQTLSGGYTLLAFIEDCKVYDNPREAPAYTQLVSVFRFSPRILEELINYSRDL
jgi:hypothetical protein